MSTVRDWSTTLWSGSYKGVSFYFDKEEAEGGRDLVEHQFPNRDDPFIEDLGEALREYTGDLYVHGDNADASSAVLEEMFASRGAGILVVPIRGPIIVHCKKFKRVHDKDKLGLVAFNVKFVRAGAATSLISVPLAGRLVLDAGDRLATVLAGLFPVKVTLANQPDYVVAAASDGVAQVAAALDVARQSWSVDPVVSGKVRDAVAAVVDQAPTLLARVRPTADQVTAFAASVAKIVTAPAVASALAPAFGPSPSVLPGDGPTLIAQTLIETTRALAAGMSPVVAAAAMANVVDTFAPATLGPAVLAGNGALARANARAADQLGRLAALMAWADAITLRAFTTRPEGIAARAEAADRFEVELNEASGADNAALFVAIEELRGRVIEYLSRLITDLAPVVTVEASRHMPSLYWAWRLYADPARAAELVARNQVRHPSFMPLSFSAVEPR